MQTRYPVLTKSDSEGLWGNLAPMALGAHSKRGSFQPTFSLTSDPKMAPSSEHLHKAQKQGKIDAAEI